ncbi:hypothetical protein SYNPS1DRAFT_21810 [Syncephalis pseudoplumigaleata]|uniref:Transmembrane protein n=1 Tax=Syncephalis pseudoplumigaleata TaxID=1712513 RepID=A0A4P9Z248_9FUNG|nr:hypothetical protein SYNPS1DRAFT_21810 [Syncephalis pseudoplumigaleata]|eukprot:RKP26425.1 hypothetical protein SYNPS1DRAFT_21810 [Syncephalis pseudoplumigaleata]
MRLRIFITAALYAASFYLAAHAAPSNSAPSAAANGHGADSAGHSKSSSGTRTGAMVGIGVCVFGMVVAGGVFTYRYRRRKQNQQSAAVTTVGGVASSRPGAGGGRGAMRGSMRPSRSSSIMLRHAVQNNSNHLTFGAPTPSMKRGGRRKGAPTAIMVEAPPASVNMSRAATTPSGTGAGQRVAAQRSVGLHVPPSPAYDFRGRGNEMPVTPRTPCMTMPTSGNAVADRMV